MSLAAEGLGILDLMRAGVDYTFPVKIREFHIQLRPLTVSETLSTASQVAEALKGVPESARNALTEHCYLAKYTLEKASTPSPLINKPVLTHYIMDHMTADELVELFQQYVKIVEQVSPSIEHIGIEGVKKLVDQIKKNTDEGLEDLDSLLTKLSLQELRSTVRFFLTKDD